MDNWAFAFNVDFLLKDINQAFKTSNYSMEYLSFLICKNQDNISVCFIGLSRGLNEFLHANQVLSNW